MHHWRCVANRSIKYKFWKLVTPWNNLSKLQLTRHLHTAIEQSKSPITFKVNSRKPANSKSKLLTQVAEFQNEFKHCVCLIQVGQFYELYFKDAEIYAPLLGLKVAWRKSDHGYPMAGFPCYQLDKYCRRLVQDLGKFVALIEQDSRLDAQGTIRVNKPQFIKRKVCRIITPGTLIDEKFMDGLDRNILASVELENAAQSETIEPNSTLSLAWCELSTGMFITTSVEMKNINDLLARLAPREVVCKDKLLIDSLRKQTSPNIFWSFQNDHGKRLQATKLTFDSWMTDFHVEAKQSMPKLTGGQIDACTLVLQYLELNKVDTSKMLRPPTLHQQSEVVGLDAATLKALELKTNLQDGGSTNTLLSLMRRTCTKSGGRALADALLAPLTNPIEIEKRLDIVQFFLENPKLRTGIQTLLKQTTDFPRLLQKFSTNNFNGEDMVTLSETLTIYNNAFDSIKRHEAAPAHFVDVLNSEPIPKSLVERIDSTFDKQRLQQEASENEYDDLKSEMSEGSNTQGEYLTDMGKVNDEELFNNFSSLMKPDASAQLTNLHAQFSSYIKDKSNIELSLKNKYFAKVGQFFRLRYRPIIGPYLDVKGRHSTLNASLGDDEKCPLTLVSSTKSTYCLICPEWTILCHKIIETFNSIKFEESRIMAVLARDIVSNMQGFHRIAKLIDQIDIGISNSIFADQFHLVRPTFCEEPIIEIKNGRHPIAESGLREKKGISFVENDCNLTSEKNMWFITGPNMGGKSTFLRQTAMIVVLAQMGSFVPCESAKIGIVDQILTRIGSGDNIYASESTFMVEMVETAQILKSATSRSLVVMDEIGRGTTTLDGISIAMSCLSYLHQVIKCRALFASHFFELAEWLKIFERCEFKRTELIIDNSKENLHHFDYKLIDGINDCSHGIKVAELAGLPVPALNVASSIFAELQTNRKKLFDIPEKTLKLVSQRSKDFM